MLRIQGLHADKEHDYGVNQGRSLALSKVIGQNDCYSHDIYVQQRSIISTAKLTLIGFYRTKFWAISFTGNISLTHYLDIFAEIVVSVFFVFNFTQFF